MVFNPSREVTVYPYTYEFDGLQNNVKEIMEKFSIDNVSKNIREYTQDTFLVLVADDESNDFIFGRFLKLKNDTPIILNRQDGSQKRIELLDDENIAEQSHFILNIKDKIIFGEYNFEAVRHFSKPMVYYLNKIFDVKDNKVIPIPDVDTFSKLQGEEEINLFRLRVSQQNMNFLEQKFSLPSWKVLMDLASDNETSFEIIVKKSRKRDSFLNKDKTIEFSNNLKKENTPLEVLKIETEDIVYDLINNNLVSFRVNVKNDGRKIDTENFYFQIRKLYDKHIEKLKSSLKKD